MKLKNIFLTVLTVFILMQTASANVKTEYRTAYGIIEVKGNIDSQSIVAGKYVTLLLYGSDGELCHIGQVDVKRDGSYEYAFAVANYTDNMNLKIKAGDCDITETLSQAIYKNSALEYINYGIHEIDSSTEKVVIDLSRIKKYCSDFEVVIAVYEGTEVKNTIVKNSSDLKNKKIMSEVVPNGDEIKVFVWDSFRNVMPFGITKKYDTDTEISFGEAADAVYDNGFAALEGNDVYSRYQSAVEEIPEEYPALSLMENRSLNSFYVSPGSSRGMGTIDKPLGSISEAINAYNLLSDDEKSWWNEKSPAFSRISRFFDGTFAAKYDTIKPNFGMKSRSFCVIRIV